MANAIRESFDLIIVTLRFVGLYPSDKNQPCVSVLKKIWMYVLYFSQVVLLLLVLANVIFKQYSDVMLFNQMVMFLSQGTATCLKVLPFLRNTHRMKKCIEYFGNSRFTPRSKEEREIMTECVGICRRNVRLYFVALLFTVTVWNFYPLVQKSGRLSVDMWLPCDLTQPLVYYLMYFYSAGVCYYMGLVSEMMEPLIGGLAYHATCQLKILKLNLRNLTLKFDNVCEEIERCVIHHDDILRFIKEFENCFSFCIFCQLGASIFDFCLCCIGMITAGTSLYTYVYLTCYLVVFFQVLFYCHYGTLLFEENESLINDMYMSFWYKCDLKVQTSFLIIMERSKKPVILTAGKIINLTYNTFTSILKTSYSLIAVVNNF
ncbi:hypothetical protein Zmor_028057 [Zophobas morio]|uniref:Odorant receptor n=1 Tax=Zophobas morio TaxID=2755281 RepID=A0AA38HQ62_9CUCU|nr:hypothetical protein Zmor_028057 [Zophobas morio]